MTTMADTETWKSGTLWCQLLSRSHQAAISFSTVHEDVPRESEGSHATVGRVGQERRGGDIPPLFQKLSHILILSTTHQPQPSPSRPYTLFFRVGKPLITISSR